MKKSPERAGAMPETTDRTAWRAGRSEKEAVMSMPEPAENTEAKDVNETTGKASNGEARADAAHGQRHDQRHDGAGHAGQRASGDSGGGHEVIEVPTDLPRPRGWMVAVAVVVLLVGVAGLYVLGRRPREADAQQAAEYVRTLEADKPVVMVTHPTVVRDAAEISLPCDINAYSMTSVFARAQGYIRTVRVDIGDRVKEGDVLAELDAPDLEAQLRQSEANLEQKKASVARARADFDIADVTLRRFLEANANAGGGQAVAQLDVDQKRADAAQRAAALKQAQADQLAAEADVERLRTLVGFTRVVAPFSGTITARGFDPGALITPDLSTRQPLFVVAQLDPMRVNVAVPQSTAGQVRVGARARLTVSSLVGRVFEGKVARTAGAVDPATRTLLVQVEVANPEGLLLPGSYGRVTLDLTGTGSELRVPSSALVFEPGGTSVLVVKDGKVEKRAVKVGRDFGDVLEITAGLNEQDAVIPTPGPRLTEGRAVEVAQGR